MTFRKAIKEAVHCALCGAFDGEMWGDIRTGAVAVAWLMFRVLVLIALPVSVPLLAWLFVKDEQLTAKQNEAARVKARGAIHRNGP